jgi:hypothetical protein
MDQTLNMGRSIGFKLGDHAQQVTSVKQVEDAAAATLQPAHPRSATSTSSSASWTSLKQAGV